MRTKSEIAAALKAHQKKYPLRLAGIPIDEYYKRKAEREAKEREDKRSEAAEVASVDALPAPH